MMTKQEEDTRDTGQLMSDALRFLQTGLLPQAEEACRGVLTAQPSHGAALHLLGLVYLQAGLTEAAIDMLGMAVRNDGRQAAWHANLAVALKRRGEQLLEEAADAPDASACIHSSDDCFKQALRHADKAVRLQPDFANAHFNRATLLKEHGEVQAALQSMRRALRLEPGMYEAWNEMGGMHLKLGETEKAREAYLKAAGSPQDGYKAFSNYLLTLNYDVLNAGDVYQAHRQWEERFASACASSSPHANRPDTSRRLKIGYVSADFHFHSVAYFAAPMIEGHRRDAFEVFCYSDSRRNDAMQGQLRSAADVWRDTADMDDSALGQCIARDGIDILVDLGGHTAGNRLRVFAARPAPLQVSYIGYPNTTGLSSMTHRIVDAVTDPPGSGHDCSERLLRLPGGFLCYAPSAAVREAPTGAAGRNEGRLRFGCFNILAKISDETVHMWSGLLHELPQATLVIKNISMLDKSVRLALIERFRKHGIARKRLELIGWQASLADHFSLYRDLDLMLDTFPYNGTTTTCEALYLGVPVVTLAGEVHAARVGASLLTHIGREDLVAGSAGEYQSIVCGLAADAPRLNRLRNDIQVQARQVLCDSRRLVDEVETVYRDIWSAWCADQ